MKTLKYKIVALIVGVCTLSGCSDYLDVVPDNLATLDITFNNRSTTERYLYTCYSYIPHYGSHTSNPGMAAGNEIWYHNERQNYGAFQIALGLQSAQSPMVNYWDGYSYGRPLFQALRDCNIFLEYVSDRNRVSGLSEFERRRWLAEVSVLKAFYHYYLFQLYGPIPIIDKNLSIDATPEETMVHREKVDDVVAYIVNLIDDSYANLPQAIQIEGTEMGRLTQPAALAIKAKVLLLAASPLFNGNTDFANYRDHDGQPFINQTPNTQKWKTAADAALAAINSAEMNGHGLYYFKDEWPIALPTELEYGMNVRGAITQRFTKELVWSVGKQSTHELQVYSAARLPAMKTAPDNYLFGNAKGEYAPTLATAERFYSKNGVPIEEDKEWAANGWYSNRYQTQTITNEVSKYLMRENGQTAVLNFNREYRFYGAIGFDNGAWYGGGWKNPDAEIEYLSAKRGEFGGLISLGDYSITGYFAKKLVNVEREMNVDGLTTKEYPFPIVRLADLYLMYAEALNESTEGAAVNPEIYTYLDRIRARSGLKGVVESWATYSTNPTKPATIAGMREIIRRERTIELALEGHHYFDTRRWRLATSEFNKPVRGWNVFGETVDDYYRVVTVHVPKIYLNKQYFWPIREDNLVVNQNLIQSYGW